MVQIYANLIINGKKRIEDVPEKIRDKVKKLIEEME